MKTHKRKFKKFRIKGKWYLLEFEGTKNVTQKIKIQIQQYNLKKLYSGIELVSFKDVGMLKHT